MAYPGPPQQYPQYPPQYPAQQPPQYPPQYAQPVRPPSPALVPTMRVDAVQGTPFGVAYPTVQAVPSGPGIGALVAGIASTLVALFAMCLGATGASEGWGLAAGGAFTVLGVFLGGGALGLGLYGTRQIRRAEGRVITGRGMAITGVVLGAVGAGLALFALVVPLAAA
jgi:hypothetical protein